MKKFKVCHFTSVHSWNDIRIFQKECVSIAKAGHEVHLVAGNCESVLANGVHVHGVKLEHKRRLDRMWKSAQLIYDKAVSIDADIYHFHDPELLRFALKLKRKGKIVIYDSHEDLPKQVLSKFWIPKIFRIPLSWMVKSYEAFISKRLSGVISVNDQICERFRETNKCVEKIANYALLHELSAPKKEQFVKKENQIVYVGGLSETRGIRELVQAIEDTSIELALAGTFAPVSFGESIQGMKGWKNVNFKGFLERNKIVEVLQESCIGLVTLHPTPSYIEALPIKLFEYMSFGLPVICSNFPIWKKIIDTYNCGICVDPENPKEIAEAVQKILGNKELALEMGENGRKAVLSDFNWETEEKKLLTFYSKLNPL